MILTILMLLLYLVIGAATILFVRNRTLDILRLIAGIAFMLIMTATALNAQNPDGVLVFALAVCLFLSVEITGFKEAKGDRSRLFMIHAFTLMISAVLIIMLLTQ
ncbi:membrane stabilizing protein MspA [Salinicoccus sp. ID82-1]|uniref:membrane stabilizing protein MspA n=1 Tax=Salinicoccus sp. ID82-1 TaxID=2820269 RepID=UPI001F2085F8|nr:membrane stabilizing protein MspA [Salinicoccus sp. ID82-1]MCG1010427.1 membrane stabilizing protein MspA [Salinicoccus sp. ID82-1]